MCWSPTRYQAAAQPLVRGPSPAQVLKAKRLLSPALLTLSEHPALSPTWGLAIRALGAAAGPLRDGRPTVLGKWELTEQ